MTNIIYAAPGAGKTSFCLQKIDDMLRGGVKESEILFCTFTTKAAMAPEIFGEYFGTLHSICLRELKKVKITNVLDRDDFNDFSKQYNYDIRYSRGNGYLFQTEDAKYMAYYNLERSNPDAFEKEIKNKFLIGAKYKRFKKDFDEYKKATNKIDFAGMIEEVIKNCDPLNLRAAFMDEAQDSSTLLWKGWNHLTKNIKEKYIVGDPNQAIYGFTGSDVDYFIDLKNQPNTRVLAPLNRSFRLNPNTIKQSKYSLNQIKNKVDFNVVTHKAELPEESLWEEAIRYIKFKDLIEKKKSIFLLSRNNSFLRLYEKWLNLFEINYRLTKYGKTKTINNKGDNNPYLIEVSSIHSVKGREADYVYLLTNITRSVQKSLYYNRDVEMRILYTACTRAIERYKIIFGEFSGRRVERRYTLEDLKTGGLK